MAWKPYFACKLVEYGKRLLLPSPLLLPCSILSLMLLIAFVPGTPKWIPLWLTTLGGVGVLLTRSATFRSILSVFALPSCWRKPAQALLFTTLSLLGWQSSQAQSCNCKEYVYLNEPVINSILKFEVGAGVPLTEVLGANGGTHWYPGLGTSDVINPHGLASDLNGNLYVTGGDPATGPGYQRKLSCDGELSPLSATTI